ncbi:MAG: ChaN family lipoprotein [Gemmatimonadota bacterium]
MTSSPRRRKVALCAVALFLVACASAGTTTAPAPATESRVYDTGARKWVDFRTLADAAAKADVVFFGEQHDDPATHRAELALLAAVGARRPNVVVSLEMFDRDVQAMLDAYLAGQLPESAFVANSRPWARYNTDYRALVELARANGWPVIASNPTRRLATAVSRVGIAVLDTMAARDRAMVARELSCPRDSYFERFAESMKGHSAGGGPPSAKDSADAAALTWRFYEAQCVKDETMGESIAAAHAKAGQRAIVLHYNGSFHSDMGLGTAARARRRMSGAKSLVVTAVPVDDIAKADAVRFADRADYVIVTPRPPKPR